MRIINIHDRHPAILIKTIFQYCIPLCRRWQPRCMYFEGYMLQPFCRLAASSASGKHSQEFHLLDHCIA